MAEPTKHVPLDILILGGGIAGVISALALTKFAPQDAIPRIQIFEIRPEPGTQGGGVNITPNALRLLDHLGALEIMKERGYGVTVDAIEVFDVYSGKLAESTFRGPDGQGMGNPPHKVSRPVFVHSYPKDPSLTTPHLQALRIARGEILKAGLAVAETMPNISFTCNKRTTHISETADAVSLTFDDGTSATGDLLLGCDGIHSITRLMHVEPDRVATYSGCCAVFGYAPYPSSTATVADDDKAQAEAAALDSSDAPLFFDVSAISFARRGMLLTSFHGPARDSMYVGALMQQAEIASRDGWKAARADEAAVRDDLRARFAGAREPLITRLIERTSDFYLWPVFNLSKHGRWSTGRTMLVGDSAHAMAPQGQSTGIVFEDAILLARFLARWMEKGLGRREGEERGTPREAFEAFERFRRKRIDVAFDESQVVLKSVNDVGSWGHWFKMKIIPWYLWWTNMNREKYFVDDVTLSELNY
ncbi:MAG: hypothetical protein M1822_004812 [Bathelium mastoideum]|nr:MAG: hypothetical protein M1822_004812 [Bathelium mastoideum]